MKRNDFYILFIFLLGTGVAVAQLDSIQQLPEVMLTDAKLVRFSKGFKMERLTDSVVERNSSSLTESLRYNTSIYFKENGFGMVSSPSFRGTNAAQTAVVWNGININSVFTGQADFNTISPLSYDEITIRSGGGGVQYGSGAVGGSIHLNNTYSFKKINASKLGVQYGSFSTLSAQASTTQTWGDHYVNVGANFVRSENDYDYVGKGRKNQHGQFVRFSAKLNEARRLRRGVATFNSEYSYNDRNFSGSLTTVGRDAYKDIATRNLWQIRQKFGAFHLKGSAAHLFEEYSYFPNSQKPTSSGGKANTFIGGLQVETLLLKNIKALAKLEYTYVEAQGDNVGDNSRKTLAAVLLLNHKLSEKFTYGFNFRKEFLNGFDNPFLFSADAKYQVSESYALRANGSKNYRVPTFNDLYWYAGGNLDLRPETSYQVELGQEWALGNWRTDLAIYYISSDDMIKWIPGNGGLWQPVNINRARSYGAEVVLGYFLQLNGQRSLDFSGSYSYTRAQDVETDKLLMYVPAHKARGVLVYSTSRFSCFVQGLYNGRAYTTTDNSASVDPYTILNLGVQYNLPTHPEITLGGRLSNVFNTYYENVAYRPMPSRNVQIFLNFNI